LNASRSEYGSQDLAELFLHNSPVEVNLKGLHPTPVQTFRLWQTFLERVNPITKLIHTQTVQQRILDSIGNWGRVSEGFEALAFSIYAVAVVSMSSDECKREFQVEKEPIRRKYEFAARQALINAGLLKTNELVVLQAFALFLVST
jgi:hypothetical protein